MKSLFTFIVVLFNVISLSSQKIIEKTIEFNSNAIEINTMGLDDLIIQNTKQEKITITLYSDDDQEKHQIAIEKKYEILKIAFEIKEFQEPKQPVMKPITERLKRANAVIKIPKNKNISIYGINNNITALNYKGSLSISIENGIVKLGAIQQKVAVKLYAGNVFASVKETNLSITSNLGKIKIDDKLYAKEFELKQKYFSKELEISSIKANVFLEIL